MEILETEVPSEFYDTVSAQSIVASYREKKYADRLLGKYLKKQNKRRCRKILSVLFDVYPDFGVRRQPIVIPLIFLYYFSFIDPEAQAIYRAKFKKWLSKNK